MATSSKVLFKLDELKRQALTAIDERITAKRHEVELHDVSGTIEQEMDEWRASTISRIEDLFNKRYEIDNYSLSQFKLAPLPRRDNYQRDRMARELDSLQARRVRIVAKSGSLVADADGNIALTKTQLREFFDL